MSKGYRDAVLLVYDIPTGAKVGVTPAWYFRKMGIRINLSCWIIPSKRIVGSDVKQYLSHLSEVGATWHIVRFDKSEKEEIMKLALAALEKEVKSIRDSLDKRIAQADKMLAKKSANVEDAVNFKRYSVRRAKSFLKQASEAAMVFDITAETKDLFESIHKYVAGRQEALLMKDEDKPKAKAKAKKARKPAPKREPVVAGKE